MNDICVWVPLSQMNYIAPHFNPKYVGWNNKKFGNKYYFSFQAFPRKLPPLFKLPATPSACFGARLLVFSQVFFRRLAHSIKLCWNSPWLLGARLLMFFLQVFSGFLKKVFWSRLPQLIKLCRNPSCLPWARWLALENNGGAGSHVVPLMSSCLQKHRDTFLSYHLLSINACNLHISNHKHFPTKDWT